MKHSVHPDRSAEVIRSVGFTLGWQEFTAWCRGLGLDPNRMLILLTQFTCRNR